MNKIITVSKLGTRKIAKAFFKVGIYAKAFSNIL